MSDSHEKEELKRDLLSVQREIENLWRETEKLNTGEIDERLDTIGADLEHAITYLEDYL